MGKKKKKETRGLPKTHTDALMRVRGYVFDSQISNADEIAVLLGCSPISDEVYEREEEESDARIDRILYLAPMLYAYSDLLSKGAMAYQRSIASKEMLEMGEDVWDETIRMMEKISRAVLVGAISQLVDMDQLRVRKASKKKGKKDV